MGWNPVDMYKKVVGETVKAVPLIPIPGVPSLGMYDQLRKVGQKVMGGGPGEPAPEPARQSGGGGGGGGQKKHNPLVAFVRGQSPGMSKHEAKKLIRDYQIDQAAPGLSSFIQENTNRPDPNAMSMFFQQTVAPYLEQTNQQYQQGAAAGTAAMQSILSGAAPSPAIDVLKSFLPLQQAGNQQMGAALDAATRTAPYYDQLLQQLNENISQQQKSQFYDQQLAASGAAGGAAPQQDFGAAIAADAAKQAR